MGRMHHLIESAFLSAGKTASPRVRAFVASLVTAAAACGLSACDNTVSSQKFTKTTTSETPDGTKKTTETTEKTVEVDPKK